MTLYPVIAYRFGMREKHSYLVGVYSKESTAMLVADTEEADRAGKYVCEVIEVSLDENYDMGDRPYFSVIKKLPVALDLDRDHAHI